jgi:hypothetical protein
MPSRIDQRFLPALPSSLLGFFCAAPAWAVPIIVNQPSMMPGNVVGVEGSGFGSSPRILFSPMHSSQIQAKLIKGDNNFVAFEVPKSQPFDVYRIAISEAMSRLMLKSAKRASLVENLRSLGAGFAYGSGGTQFAAPVNLSKSDAYSLTVTAPAASRHQRSLCHSPCQGRRG